MGLKLVSWNVNGLRACVSKGCFQEFMDKENPDVICLQETKLQEGQIKMDLPGYEEYWNYAEKKGYSGTAIFTKEKPISVTYGLGIEEHDHEGRVITAEYNDYYLVTVYVPNAKGVICAYSQFLFPDATISMFSDTLWVNRFKGGGFPYE